MPFGENVPGDRDVSPFMLRSLLFWGGMGRHDGWEQKGRQHRNELRVSPEKIACTGAVSLQQVNGSRSAAFIETQKT